ncbi:MAG TPA: DUF192 domain-containing protein [Candidatus Saccharimonadales bacterium]|nr:DUF192 domain-containing protein [Candidatus Saccharimonadales bacterium]
MITLSVKKASTNLEKMVGLIGKQHPYSLLLETRFGIHTFGVQFPIDVIILDKHYMVRDLFIYMKPSRIFFWNPLFPYVLELPQGTIEKMKIKKDETIKLVVK